MAMKFLKGTTGSKRGMYNLVSRHTKLPKMQEVEILPWGGGIGLALRWRGGGATLGLVHNHSPRRQGGSSTLGLMHNHSPRHQCGQLTISTMGERGNTIVVPMTELEELGLVEEVE